MSAAKHSGAMVPGGQNIRIFIGFSIIGFANTILPSIIFSGLYLIIPYPPPIVLLVELLPAIASKLLFSHLLSYTPRIVWPLLLVSCWALAAVVTDAAPPNVHPFVRILIAMLASASAATTEVVFLSQLRYYGRSSLAGWGTGTGAGGMVVAIMPSLLTHRMGAVMRSATIYVYYLAIAIAAAYFFILPPFSTSLYDGLDAKNKLDAALESEEPILLIVDPPVSNSTYLESILHKLELAGRLIRPCMVPLLLSTVAQVLISPGLSRACSTSGSFDGYAAFAAAYGLSFQFGNLVSRSTTTLLRTRRPRLTLTLVIICSAMVFFNTMFLFSTNLLVVLTSLFTLGFFGGAMYINVFSMTMEYMSRSSDLEAEYALGVVGTGETFGNLLGSLAGVIFEAQFCSRTHRSGRWCSNSR